MMNFHPASPFRNKSHRLLLTALFFEGFQADNRHAIYTVSDSDKEVRGVRYRSLKRLFLEARDPTEYLFATKYFSGWEHWQKVQKIALLRPVINEWRDELELLIRAEALALLIQKSSKGGYQAQKYLLERGWDTDNTQKELKTKQREIRDAAYELEVKEMEHSDLLRLQETEPSLAN